MSIRFACPSCHTPYTVNDRDAGKKSDCKVCGQRLEVPEPARLQTVLGGTIPLAPPPVPDARGGPHDEPAIRAHRSESGDEPVSRDAPRWRDEDEPDHRGRRPAVRRPGLAIAQLVVWIVAGGLTVLVGLVWLLMMTNAKSAVQESSGSAMAAAVLIGVYVVARAADKVLGIVRSLRDGRV